MEENRSVEGSEVGFVAVLFILLPLPRVSLVS